VFWFCERDLGRCLVDFVRGLPPFVFVPQY
jgi:hypothetical protein